MTASLGPGSGVDGVARDVIRFGAGITAADIQLAARRAAPPASMPTW